MPSAQRTVDSHNALRHHAVVGLSGGTLRSFYEYFGFTHFVVEEIPDTSYIQALTGGAWSSAVISGHRQIQSKHKGNVAERIYVGFAPSWWIKNRESIALFGNW